MQHMPFLHDQRIKELIINHINPLNPDKIEVAMVSDRSVVNYPVVKLMITENLTHPHWSEDKALYKLLTCFD